MELYIGGYAQGKLEYVQRLKEGQKVTIKNEFHIWVKEMINQGIDAEAEVDKFCRENPDCMIICDEIGNGMVPMDAKEREYRDRLGKILIEIAEKSDRVERIICGLGQRLK